MPKREAAAILIIIAFVAIFVSTWYLQIHAAFSDKMLLDNMRNECDQGLTLQQKSVLVAESGTTTTKIVVGCFASSTTAGPL